MKIYIVLAIVIAAAFFIYQSQQIKPEAEMNLSDANNVIVDFSLSEAPENADVFILEPGDGSTVQSPVTIKFGIANMQVSPAGIDAPHSGHHHLLLDLSELPDMTQPLPATDNLIHFGKGQTEVTLELPAGTHNLQLLLGNYLHVPHNPPLLSKQISIIVE